jgi:hypothetical protein
MNWMTWRISKTSWLKNVMSRTLKRGVSIPDRRYSRYSLTPRNAKYLTTGKAALAHVFAEDDIFLWIVEGFRGRSSRGKKMMRDSDRIYPCT